MSFVLPLPMAPLPPLRWRWLGRLLLVVLAYHACGRLALAFPHAGSLVSLLWAPAGIAFAAAAVVANVFPFGTRSDTGALMALHLPIALWLVVGVAYVGGRWFAGSGRMDFVRFSGELVIYYVLIALGGALYTAGGVVYGLRRPNPFPQWFGFHEVFHAFTVIAFAAHYAGVSIATYTLS